MIIRWSCRIALGLIFVGITVGSTVVMDGLSWTSIVEGFATLVGILTVTAIIGALALGSVSD